MAAAPNPRAGGRNVGVAPASAPGAAAWTDPAFGWRGPAGALVEALFALEPEAWMRRVPGRETFAWPGRPAWVVKRFEGGEARDWWYDSFARRERRSPGRREGENLVRLRADGIAAPRPLAWVEERRATLHPRLGGRAARSALVMERVPHAETLAERLAVAGAKERALRLRELAALVARLHRAGWYHRDLYLEHVVLGPEGLVLLDAGRARAEAAPRRRWFVKDLAALLHSAPPAVGRSARLRFLALWLERALGGERGELRRWARSVLKKERRLAAHAPRHVHVSGSEP